MNRTTRMVTLDVSRENNFAYYAKQADALSRFLKIRFTEGGNDITLSPTDKVILTVERADGRKVVGLGSVASDGTATVEFTSSMLAVVGEGECEVSVTGENGFVLTTLSFVLYVEKKLCDDNAIESSNEFPVFMQALAEMAKLERDINDAATDALKGKMTYRGEVSTLPENAAIGDVYKLAENVYYDGYCRVPFSPTSVACLDSGIDRIYLPNEVILCRALKCAYEAYLDTGCALEIIAGETVYSFNWVGMEEYYIDVEAVNDTLIYHDLFGENEYGFIKLPLSYAEEDDAVLLASIHIPSGGAAVYDGEKWVSLTAESVTELLARVAVLEEAVSETDTSCGFKKIGFTDDCDYVATAEDGYSAFAAAIEAASDGDTILVMPGTYNGTERFDVTKNIDFIGVGKPEITFPVWIQGGGIYSWETYEWEVRYPSVTSKWSGFDFAGGFSVGCEFDSNNDGGAGYAYLDDCTINSEGGINICGKVRNCFIDVLSFASGHYYGINGGTFEGCTIRVKNGMDFFGVTLKLCELYPATASSYEYYSNNAGGTSFSGCKIYAVGANLEFNDVYGGSLSLGDTIVFANSCNSGYLVTPTAK